MTTSQPHEPTISDASAGFRPSGAEWTIAGHGYQAVVTAVGASLRLLTFRGRDLVVPFGPEEIRPNFRGATIAPWPNRLRDGRYEFGGRRFQVPINEVPFGNALHGLVHWERWTGTAHTDSAVSLAHELVPQDGYPFALRLVQHFELQPDGLVTTLEATNIGTDDAPYGCCPHPYLVAGAGPVDRWTLQSPHRTILEVDDRLLPLRQISADSVDRDFREPHLIGDRAIDHAFTDLGRDSAGTAAVEVRDPAGGGGVRMTWGEWAPWLQIHTADRPEPRRHRIGLAVEPMSCPPDAFNSGGFATLRSGATHTASWTIGAIAAANARS